MSDWKSKLASKFKGNKDYEVLGNDDEGINIESYKKTSDEFGEPIPTAPKTEPIKRKPLTNGGIGNGRLPKDDPNKQQISSFNLVLHSNTDVNICGGLIFRKSELD